MGAGIARHGNHPHLGIAGKHDDGHEAQGLVGIAADPDNQFVGAHVGQTAFHEADIGALGAHQGLGVAAIVGGQDRGDAEATQHLRDQAPRESIAIHNQGDNAF